MKKTLIAACIVGLSLATSVSVMAAENKDESVSTSSQNIAVTTPPTDTSVSMQIDNAQMQIEALKTLEGANVEQKALANEAEQLLTESNKLASIEPFDRYIQNVAQKSLEKTKALENNSNGKKAERNKFDGYDADVYLSDDEAKAFMQDPRFIEQNKIIQERFATFSTELQTFLNKTDEMTRNIENVSKADIEALKLPTLPTLTDEEKSFMFIVAIDAYDSVNPYVEQNIKPQKDLLFKLKDFADKSKKLLTQAVQIDIKPQELDIMDEIMKTGNFVKNKDGQLEFKPNVKVEMPKIDFSQNCDLLKANYNDDKK